MAVCQPGLEKLWWSAGELPGGCAPDLQSGEQKSPVMLIRRTQHTMKKQSSSLYRAFPEGQAYIARNHRNMDCLNGGAK